MTRADAIAAKCKECIYDPEEDGTWRQQVKACVIDTCALHPYRPMPYKVRNQPVEREYEVLNATPGSGKGQGVAPHIQSIGGGK